MGQATVAVVIEGTAKNPSVRLSCEPPIYDEAQLTSLAPRRPLDERANRRARLESADLGPVVGGRGAQDPGRARAEAAHRRLASARSAELRRVLGGADRGRAVRVRSHLRALRAALRRLAARPLGGQRRGGQRRDIDWQGLRADRRRSATPASAASTSSGRETLRTADGAAAWPRICGPSRVAVGVGCQPCARRASSSSSALGR